MLEISCISLLSCGNNSLPCRITEQGSQIRCISLHPGANSHLNACELDELDEIDELDELVEVSERYELDEASYGMLTGFACTRDKDKGGCHLCTGGTPQ